MTKRNTQLGLTVGMMFAAANVFAAPAPTPTPVTISYLFNDSTGVYANPGLDSTVSLPTSLENFSQWTDTKGTLIANGLLGSSSSRAIAAAGWDGSGNTFQFSFTVASGYKLSVSNISFLEQGSNGSGKGLGPTTWTLGLNGNQILNGSATRGSFGTQSGGLSLSNLTGTQSFSLGASGAAASGANAASTATWRAENFTITGSITPVPVPAAVWLLGSAMAGVVGWRRRAA